MKIPRNCQVISRFVNALHDREYFTGYGWSPNPAKAHPYFGESAEIAVRGLGNAVVTTCRFTWPMLSEVPR